MSASIDDPLTRRGFLTTAGQGLLTATLTGGLAHAAGAQGANPPPQPPLPLPPTAATTEKRPGPAPRPQPPDRRVGFGVVGLGNLALQQILPAFGECKRAKLAARVSGDAAKANQVAQEHGLPPGSVYDYQTYDRLRDNPNVQVIYIVLPNPMHMEYTVRGAQADKHVLCEKPMATSPKECQAMIDACRKADRKLMIAYRIQYEPHNRMIQQMVRGRKYGPVKLIESVNGQNQGDPNQWRLKKALAGGGSLPDVGLYCLNTTRFLLGEEPTEVAAMLYSTPGDPRFREIEESVTWQMRFPSGALSNNATFYGAHEDRRYRVHAPTGWFGLDPAFSYGGLQMQVSYAQGPVEHRETPQIESQNQFALEMDHMAECVQSNKTPYTPGEEGLQDHRIMAAIYESARSGKPVKLPKIAGRDSFRGKDQYETRTTDA